MRQHKITSIFDNAVTNTPKFKGNAKVRIANYNIKQFLYQIVNVENKFF